VRIGINANPKFSKAMALAQVVWDTVGKEHEVLLEEGVASRLGGEGRPLDELQVDVLITIGGDGTILRTLQRNDSVILGVNLSRVGFLTQAGEADIEDALRKLLAGEYRIDERLKLKVEVDGERWPDCTNEAVIHSAQVAKIRQFRIRVDGDVADSVRADGIIVATPTGSTCYSMSTGGPIIDPRVEALVITAIAPFRLFLRPLVVPPKSEVEVTLPDPRPCVLVLDGQTEGELSGEESLMFTASEKPARFVKLQDDFYRRVETKLVGQ
jgi:NAD+ kinase